MALLHARLALNHFFAPEVLIFGVGLCEIAEFEPLPEIQLANFLVAAADEVIQPPLRVRRRTFPSSAEELLIFDLQRANVPLDLVQVLVESGHGYR